VRELLARIVAVMRRVGPDVTGGSSEPAGDDFQFGAVMVNRKTMRVKRGGKSEDLTAREFKLISLFRAHPDEVLSRDRLLNDVWGIDYQGTTRTLDQHIVQLRKKIETEPNHPVVIQTVHGIGYRYVPFT
jgi:DNA-binding response OmpR family regulator